MPNRSAAAGVNAFTSFFIPFRAVVTVLRDSRLLRYALVPWIINIVVFIGAITAFAALDHWLMERLAAVLGTGWWVTAVAWVLGILVFVGFGAGLVLTFTFFVNIIGGFFAEQLSFHTERLQTGVERPSPEGNPLKIAARSAVEELKGVAFFISVWLASLLLNLIPVIGTAAFMLFSALWTCIALAFEFIAPTGERWGMKFRTKRKYIFNQPLNAVAFGGAIFLMTLIPVVNFFFMPFAVVAGTQWMIARGGPAASPAAPEKPGGDPCQKPAE